MKDKLAVYRDFVSGAGTGLGSVLPAVFLGLHRWELVAVATVGSAIGGASAHFLSHLHLSVPLKRLLWLKLNSDFDDSFVNETLQLDRALRDSQSELLEARLIHKADDVRLVQNNLIEVPKPLCTQDRSLLIDKIRAKNPIKVNCAVLSPAALAVLLSLRETLKARDVTLDVDFSDLNGHNQFIRVSRGEYFDFLISAEAPYFLLTAGKDGDYRKMFPCNGEWQRAFLRKGPHAGHAVQFHVFDASSAELQFILGRGIPRSASRVTIDYGEKIPYLADSLTPGECVLAWEPLAYLFDRNPSFKALDLSKFRVWISLFCHKKWNHKRKLESRNAFRLLFFDEWKRCAADRNRAFKLLINQEGLIDKFAFSSGMKKLTQFST